MKTTRERDVLDDKFLGKVKFLVNSIINYIPIERRDI